MKVNEEDEILKLLADPKKEEKGFKLLMTTYQEPLYWHIRRMIGTHEDANDVLQNTFIKVFKSINRFESKSKLYTWLYKIATNESITFINKQKRKKTEAIDDNEKAFHLKADEILDGDKIIRRLKAAISKLPEKQKMVFCMRYYDEMTYDQISQTLGTSVGGLKASYHHAVRKIEAFFKEEEYI